MSPNPCIDPAAAAAACAQQPAGRQSLLRCTKCLAAVLGTKAAGGVQTGRFIKKHFGGVTFKSGSPLASVHFQWQTAAQQRFESCTERPECIARQSRAVRWWKSAVQCCRGMQLCTTCTVWVSAAPCPGLPPPSLPPCRTGPGSHSASQGATKCLAQSPQIFKSLALATGRHLTQVSPLGRG